MATIWLLLIIVLIYLAWKLKKYVELVKIVRGIAGPRPLFPYGNAFMPMVTRYEDLGKMMIQTYANYRNQSISRHWTFYHPTIVILKASAAETVLRSTNDLTKNVAYTVLDRWLGQGLLTSTGSKWTRDRKMLTPSFHFQILNTFIDIFNEKSLILMSKLSRHESKGDVFDIFPYLTLCTLDIICDAAMGKSINAQTQDDSEYVRAIVKMSQIAAKRICFPWLTIPWIYYFTDWRKRELQCLKIMHGFTNQVIKERRADRNKQKSQNSGKSHLKSEEQPMGLKTRNRFLDMLLDISETDGRLTDTEIREQVDTFMFEGHDTTACSLNWTIYFIGRHPTVQQKVHAELDDIFMNDNERAVTSADISQMKYMEAVIKESLRMVPIVPMFGRTLESELEFDGHKIPRGSDVMIMSHYVHHDPDIYEQPDIFDPDRFLNDNKTGRHPYGFLGFSAGPRNCIGQKFALMEEKVILAHLLRHYRVVSTDKFEDMKIGASLVAKPLNGTHVKLLQRTNSNDTM